MKGRSKAISGQLLLKDPSAWLLIAPVFIMLNIWWLHEVLETYGAAVHGVIVV